MRTRRRERGQVLPLLAIALIAIFTMLALLLDGAQALYRRRALQDAADAAALAGANVIQATGSSHQCSAVAGPPPGAPRADIVAAVTASLASNLPGFNSANVSVTCPTLTGDLTNQAVRVTLTEQTGNYLAKFVLGSGLTAGASGTAVNGQVLGSKYSVVELNPYNPSWSSSRRGCPSVLFSGGPTVIFDSSIQINSACPASAGGAFATNGNAAVVNMTNGARIRIVGGYAPAALTINPAPLTDQPAIPDPLSFLDPAPLSTLPVQRTTKLIINNTTSVLQPGIYQGGIELRSSAIALLRPGIYYIQGGGLDIGAQASLCTITATSTATNCTSWNAECPDTTCGALIYNTGTASGTGAMDEISVAAGATLKMRAYDDRAHAGANFEFRNLLMWQAASPVPSSSFDQPALFLNGGGTVDISGTVYAPSAVVHMGGGSGGSGGGTNLMLQFISWDLEIQGNAAFRFYYSEATFARPIDYGLVE